MNKKHLSILNDIAELRELQHTVDQLSEQWELPMKVSMNINLVLEEIVSNIIFYGYEDDREHRILIDFNHEDAEIVITIRDDGKAFNILEAEEFDDADKSPEDRKIGGLGIHFVKTLMDHVAYKREGEENILSLTKKILTKQ